MVDVEKRERERDNYLLALYELADGMVTHWTTHRAIASDAGLSDREVQEVGQHLVQQRLCKFETMGGLEGSVSITPLGIDKAEQLLRTRTPRISDQELIRNVEVIVQVLLIEVERETSLSGDDRLNITTDLQSVQAQLMAPLPNRGIIKAGFERIRQIWPTVVTVSTVAANFVTVLRGW